MKPVQVDITIRLDMRDYGALEDLVGELETKNDPQITHVKILNGINSPEASKALFKQKPTRRRVKLDDANKIMILHKQGDSEQQIMEKLGWSSSTVARVISGKWEPAKKRNLVKRETVEVIHNLRKKYPDATNQEISNHMEPRIKVGASTVGQILMHKYNHLLKEKK